MAEEMTLVLKSNYEKMLQELELLKSQYESISNSSDSVHRNESKSNEINNDISSDEKSKYFVEEPFNALFSRPNKNASSSHGLESNKTPSSAIIQRSEVKHLTQSTPKINMKTRTVKSGAMLRKGNIFPLNFKDKTDFKVNKLNHAEKTTKTVIEKSRPNMAGLKKAKMAELKKAKKAGQEKRKKAGQEKRKNAGQEKRKMAPSKITSWVNYRV